MWSKQARISMLRSKHAEGGMEEDDSRGMAIHDPGMSAVQLGFPALAERHLPFLELLRNYFRCCRPSFAAEVLGYTKKQAVRRFCKAGNRSCTARILDKWT